MSFVRTTAISKLGKLKKRLRIIPGGTWAGKTYGILPIEINYLAKHPNTETTVVAETIPSIKKGALKIFKKIMIDTNRYRPEAYNGTDRIYTFLNGSTIQFTSFDSPDKARAAGKRNRLFVNEVNTIPQSIVDSLIIRTDDVIWLDYNPTHRFWVNDEYENDKNADWLTLTYKDNEAIPDSILTEVLNRREKAKTSDYWANWCRVYLDGEVGNLEGVVFQNWKPIDTLPETAKLLGYGLDFGFTNDPSSLIAMYRYDGKIIFDEVFYQKGLLNSQIASLIKSNEFATVWADSAEPKSIREIQLHNIPIKSVVKGRDSINYGIQVLQEHDFLVTARSTNLIKELRSYGWDTDKTGKRLGKPIDAFNHGIDAMRYVSTMLLGKIRSESDIWFV